MIENPKGKRVPLPIYKMEQNGAPPRCNLAKEAFDDVLSRSRNLRLRRQLNSYKKDKAKAYLEDLCERK